MFTSPAASSNERERERGYLSKTGLIVVFSVRYCTANTFIKTIFLMFIKKELTDVFSR